MQTRNFPARTFPGMKPANSYPAGADSDSEHRLLGHPIDRVVVGVCSLFVASADFMGLLRNHWSSPPPDAIAARAFFPDHAAFRIATADKAPFALDVGFETLNMLIPPTSIAAFALKEW